MKWGMILVILCQLQYLTFSHYNGVSTSVCESMTPNHSYLPQETGNPYKLFLNTTTYTNGSVISGEILYLKLQKQVQKYLCCFHVILTA